jgi:hypothetical protein
MRQAVRLLATALAAATIAACAAPRGEPPRLLRLSPEEAARVGLDPPRPVTLDEIVADTRAGRPAGEIVRRMRETASVYRPTAIEIERLQAAGVAREVLDFMTAGQRAEEAEAQRRRAAEEEARRRAYWADPYWPHGPYRGPYWAPSVSIGAFRHSHRFGQGYGVGFGAPWPWWW